MIDFRRGKRREDPEINLIAFIDVLLVVVIFLMVSTTFSRFTELQITLPTAEAQQIEDKPFELHVAVDAKGNYTVNQAPVAFHSVAAFAQELRRAAVDANGQVVASPVVIVNADQFAMHQSVINVLEAARLAGFDKLTFATQTGANQ